MAVDLDRSARAMDAGEGAQQAGLATAIRTNQRNCLAAGKLQVGGK